MGTITEAEKRSHILTVMLRFLGRVEEDLQCAHYFALLSDLKDDKDPGMREISKNVEEALAHAKEDVAYLKKKYFEHHRYT